MKCLRQKSGGEQGRRQSRGNMNNSSFVLLTRSYDPACVEKSANRLQTPQKSESKEQFEPI